MKRVLAVLLVGILFSSMTVLAAPSTKASDTAKNESVTPASAPSQAISAAEAVIASIERVASAEGKSVGEYTNNAVVELPGVPNVVPMGQGGHVIINGAPSNVIFFLDKPSAPVLSQAKAQAQALGGTLLNVVTTKSPVVGRFTTAQVNFYAKGVVAGQNIKVYQLVNGEWVELEVTEIREDHIVLNMTQHGTLAFVQLP